MRFTNILAFATAVTAAAVPGKTATFTLVNGTTVTVLVHPGVKLKRREEVAGITPNGDKLSKRFIWLSRSPDQCGLSTITWETNSGDWLRIAIANTCVFGIKSSRFTGIQVDSTNVYDITKDSIDVSKISGSPSRVGAEGGMQCAYTGASGTAGADWAIFFN
ncbi:hypothetical protein QBC38DRAFT_504476 [Podospora fimiseda]|uniref:Ecp2 effector protein-like domain-containing protein n=1 Tax=Podospora fimiseda TaxID=252190 RepID=A0AAN7BF98_9PEZI|nr:hypothetical protein QBC38DRAFT_504476 [Podospora fimiseda]